MFFSLLLPDNLVVLIGRRLTVALLLLAINKFTPVAIM
jgi:hypothetical protein